MDEKQEGGRLIQQRRIFQTCQGAFYSQAQEIQHCQWADWQQSDILHSLALPNDSFRTQSHHNLNDAGTWHDSKFRFQKGVLYHKGCIYVPDGQLRLQVSKHFGQFKTWNLVSKSLCWPGLWVYTKDYIRSCGLCIHTKNPQSKPTGLLQPFCPQLFSLGLLYQWTWL